MNVALLKRTQAECNSTVANSNHGKVHIGQEKDELWAASIGGRELLTWALLWQPRRKQMHDVSSVDWRVSRYKQVLDLSVL